MEEENKIDVAILTIKEVLENDLLKEEEIGYWLENLKYENQEGLMNHFREKSLKDEKLNLNRTYLVFDYNDFHEQDNIKDKKFYGAFTLSINNISIKSLSSKQRKKLFGGSSYKGILNVEMIPTVLLGKVLKNKEICCASSITFFDYVFEKIIELQKDINDIASIPFLSLDCKEVVFNKVYEKYGFKKISDEIGEAETNLTCAMNIYRL